MSPLTSTDIKETLGAYQARSTLEEVDLRSRGLNTTNPSASTARVLKAKASTNRLPIYDEKGHIFAGSVIGSKNQSLTLPGNIREGTLIEYQNQTGKTQYARVINAGSSGEANRVYVKSIDETQAESAKKSDPNIPTVTVTNSSIATIKPTSGQSVSKLFDSLDQTETLFIKFVTKLLMKEAFENEPLDVIFIQIYFRLLVIAAIVIGLFYITSNFF